MLKILIQICLFITTGLPLRAQVVDITTRFPEENVTKSLSVVEVLGALKGSGVIILLDNKPVIITNSHNIQGRKKISVKLNQRKIKHFKINSRAASKGALFEFNGMANVMMDFPLSDFSVLSFHENLSKEEHEALYMYARSNGKILKGKWHPTNTPGIYNESISAVLEGVATSLVVLAPFKGHLIEDTFISGDGKKIWLIPIYARPGVSGGAYYRHGILEGLVTKISLSAEPMALATPFESIAKTIFDAKKSEREKKATWENGQLSYIHQNNTIIVSPAGNGGLGGETGNGGFGGETGNGGGSVSSFWKLEVTNRHGSQSIMTWNPFIYRSSKFNLNGNDIAVFDIKDQFKLPSLPLYLYNEEKKNEQFPLEYSDDVIDRLQLKRLQNPQKLSFGRLYLYNEAKNQFSVHGAYYSGKNPDGTQQLIPQMKKRLANIQKNPFRPVYIFENDLEMDADGYLYASPFSLGFSKEHLLDIKLRGNYLLGLKEEQDISVETIIRASADLEEVKIKTIRKFKKDSTVSEIVLKDIGFSSLGTKVFASKDNSHTAAFIYSSDDLSKLEKIYIKSSNALMEFWVDGGVK